METINLSAAICCSYYQSITIILRGALCGVYAFDRKCKEGHFSDPKPLSNLHNLSNVD